MTFYLAVLAVIVAGTGIIILRRWLRDSRPNLDWLLNMPWWQQPVARLAIHMLKREVWQDTYEAAGFVKTVNGHKRCTLAAWRAISVSLHNGRWKVRVRVKRGFTQGNEETDSERNAKQTVLDQVAGTFGLGEYDYQWHFWFAFSHVTITPKQVVPTEAKFATPDYRDMVETHIANHPVAPPLAIGRGDQPIAVDLDTEAPHVLVSAGTIGGKSRTVCFLIACLLKADDDAIAVIIDPKEQSQRGLAAVPGVMTARSGAEINNMLVAVLTEIRRRNAICRDVPLGHPMPKFPRIIVGLEEMNDTEKLLKDWWRTPVEAGGMGQSRGQPPGYYAISRILCTGRAVRVHVVLVAQQANVQTTGGGEGRANIAVRVIAEYGPNEWKMLAHGADYIPAVSHKVQPGWCIVVHGRSVEEGQRIYMTDEEAHAWLTTNTNTNGHRATILAETFPDALDTTAIDAPGNPNPTPAPSPPVAASPPPKVSRPPQAPGIPGFRLSSARHVSTLAIGAGMSVPGDDDPDVYATLRVMVEDGSLRSVGLPLSLVALRKASQSPGFPAPVPMPGGHEYSRRAVIEWLKERPTRRARPTRGQVYGLVAGGRAALESLGRDAYVKVGYTSRSGAIRAKEIAPFRPSDIVKLIEVAHPPEGQELPDKAFHREFVEWAVHSDDPTSELFWNRGAVREWLNVRREVSA